MHCDVTCAALAAGKHVLCEARMARDLAEAQAHAGCRESSSEADSADCPSPFGLEVGSRIQTLMKDNFIGQLREYVVLGADDQFWTTPDRFTGGRTP